MIYYCLIDDYTKYLHLLKIADTMPIERYTKYLNYIKLEDKLNCIISYMMIVKHLNTSNIKLNYTEYEKPYIENKHFSISHTSGLVIVGFSSEPIGVDCEKIKEFNDNLITYMFSLEELKKHQNTLDNDFLTKNWTIKEAYIKLLGTGLPKNFHEFDITGKKYQININSMKINDFWLSVCSKSDNIKFIPFTF